MNRTIARTSATFVALLLTAPLAGASEPREHDGLYLRSSLGASALRLSRSTEREGVRGSLGYPENDSAVSGTALTLELAAGYTPFRGVAFTGLVLAEVLSPAELTLVDESAIGLRGPFLVVLVAPAVDAFPDPTRGLHVSTALGLLVAHGRIEDPVAGTIGGLGVAGTMALGYDAWVGDEWSVGGSARGLLGGLVGEEEGRGTRVSERTWVSSFGLAVTLLHH